MALPRDPQHDPAEEELAWALPVEDEPPPIRRTRPKPIEPWDEPYDLEPAPKRRYVDRYEADFDDDDYEERPRRRRKRKPKEPNKLIPLFVGYGLMLCLLVASAVIAAVIILSNAVVNPEAIETGTSAMFDVVCTFLVFIVALSIGRIRPHPTDGTMQAAAWCSAFPVLGVLLVVNISFVSVVRELFNVPHQPGPGITVVSFLLICLQPALVEEWFFRHLALGTLRKPLGLHGAVWISGTMFGFAHLLNPIAMPYLIIVGVCLGYFRVWSGGLILPMILHGVHNAVVLMADHAM